MNLYICPTCKTKNEEREKYCTQCGTWLLSERFSAQKVKKELKPTNLYICAFCDTANEPNRNACKKCFKPLFSTEYETKEIKVQQDTIRKKKWLKMVYLIGGIPFLLLMLSLGLFSTEKMKAIGAVSFLFGLIGFGITIISVLVLLFTGRIRTNKKSLSSLLLTSIILFVAGVFFTSKSTPVPTSASVKIQPAKASSTFVTKEKFDLLQQGMTYEKVTENLGVPGEITSETGFKGEKFYTVSYKYKGEGLGANAILTFQDNKLVNKTQIGLK